MNLPEITKNEFLNLTTVKVKEFVEQHGKPKVGIFVPEGTRRMAIAFGKSTKIDTNFYTEIACLNSKYLQKNIKVFFEHGLKILFVPLLSTQIFNRDDKYKNISLQQGLKLLFQSDSWLNFYQRYNIQINTYGDLTYLAAINPGIMNWINRAKEKTSTCAAHKIFYGFAAPDKLGVEMARMGIHYYKKFQREPSDQEQLELYYGENIPPADFFIMSTKFAGLGALPPLISGRETQMYFLVAPGTFSLTRETYRLILYDFLYCRILNSNNNYSLKKAEFLKQYYLHHKSTVFGIGHRDHNIWFPDI